MRMREVSNDLLAVERPAAQLALFRASVTLLVMS